jgi:hypothetical protein
MRMAYFGALYVSVDFSGAGCDGPRRSQPSESVPGQSRARIELRNLAPVGQHRLSRQKRSCAGTVCGRPVRIAHISNGLIDDVRGEGSVGGS